MDNWADFWNHETIYTDKMLHKNMEIFVKASGKLLNYSKGDVILDIGCGPGFLAGFLKERVKEIHCVDLSDQYLRKCRERFKEEKNLFFYKLGENYTNLSFLGNKRFSMIICLSVVQYYRNREEIEELIEEVRKIALPGSRFLIADIPAYKGSHWDALSILWTSLRKNYLLEELKFFFKSRFSDYYKLHTEKGLLALSPGDLRNIIKKLNLDAEVLDTPLTNISSRRHLLIKF